MEPRSRGNPFPGLRPFAQEEADLFFGRDRQSDDLVKRLAGKQFLAVVGTSGSGKSSLVRAGLLPSLEGGLMADAGAHWRIAILRPQDDPIGCLARAVVETGALGHLEMPPPAVEGVVETTLRRSSLGLVEVARLARLDAHENLLVLVDQFEELFRFADLAGPRACGDDASAFVKLLLEAARQTAARIYVVLTMRSDFLGDCARFRDLPEAISDSQYLVPRLTRDELHAVITGPVGVRGGRIAPGLVQYLLNEIGDDMDQLPVLQHALMRAWEHWEHHAPEGRAIDLLDLEAIGGMAEALSRHADEAFTALPSNRDKTIAERLFKSLTEKGAGNREIRRPTALSRVAAIAGVRAAEVISVIDVFRAPGRSFLMPPHDVTLDADSVIDISHESLIRQWDWLGIWVDEEAESRATYLRILEAARLHAAGKAGLWSEPDLTYARQWQEREAPNGAWAERYGAGFEEARAFLRDSEAANAAEVEAERQRGEADRLAKARELEQVRALAKAQRQRADEQAAARIRQRRFSWALVALLALAVATAFYGWRQRGAAEERRREAEHQSALALSRQLAGLAGTEMGRGLQMTLLLAAAANRAAPVHEARQILQRVLTSQTQLRTFLPGHLQRVSSVAFSPDGKILASASYDNTVILWQVAAQRPLGEPLAGHKGGVTSVAFSPDGRTLATASGGQTVTLWDVARRKPLGEELRGHSALSVAFSPDGKTLACAGADGVVTMWDVARRTPVGGPLNGQSGFGRSLNGIAFSPDGQTLASGTFETGIIWDVASHARVGAPLKGHDQSVTSMVFSPDGKTLASASDDGSVILWDAATHKPIGKPLASHHGRAYGIAFSPDGRTLASGNEDNTVVLWAVESGRVLGEPLNGHRGAVMSVAFSPDGKTLASGSEDTSVILWEVSGHTLLADEFQGHDKGVNSVAFSPDGTTLASGSNDQHVILWDVAGHKPAGDPLTGHHGEVLTVAFTPDGKTLASAGRDSAVILWDVATRRALGDPLKGFEGEVESLAFSPDGRTLASSVHNRANEAASADDKVILWDVASRRPSGDPLFAQGVVQSIAFSPDGKTLALARGDDTVVLWDAAARKPLGRPLKTTPYLSGIAFSPDGRMLASASAEGADARGGIVMLWDLTSGALVGEPLEGHRGFVYGVAFSPDGKTLASAGYDGVVILWDVARRRPLGDPLAWGYDALHTIAFSPDGKRVAAAGDSHSVMLWDVDVASWMRKACGIANRNLTHAEWAQYVGDDVPYRTPCPELPIPKN